MSRRPGPGDDVARAIVAFGLAAEALFALAGSDNIEDTGVTEVTRGLVVVEDET